MDALRKAEEEKRKARAAGELTGSGENTGGRIEAPAEETAAHEPAAEVTGTGETSAEPATLAPEASGPEGRAPELSLEPLAGESSGGAGAATPGGQVAAGEDTDVMDDSLELRGPSESSLEMLSQGFAARPAAEPDGEAAEAGSHPGAAGPEGTRSLGQDSTVPSDRAIKSSLAEYFDGSQSMGTASSELPRQTGPMSEAPAMDRTLGTPVSAQTVFAARGRRTGSRTLTLVIVAVIGVTVLLAAGGLYYGLQAPAPRPAPSPAVAAGVETSDREPFELPEIVPRQGAPVAPMEGEVADREIVARVQSARPDAAPAGPAATEPAGSGPAPAAAAAQADSEGGMVEPEPEAALAGEPAPPAAPASRAASGSRGAPEAPAADAQSAAASVMAAAAAPSAPENAPAMSPAALEISTAQRPPQVDETTAAAYAAYRAGDLEEAASLYGKLLEREPRNRAALLGEAAIALRRGEAAEAFERYRRVLRYYPADATANAAVLELQGYGGDAESQLKHRLVSAPESAYLHFVLGNLYARSGRWREAEQAYFEAVRLQPENPEFAFNLAVSLDRLDQGVAARRYYHRALEGAGERPVAFDTGAARRRIEALPPPAASSP